MDRLGFFKHGLSALMDAATSVIGLRHAVTSFTEEVDKALSNIKTDIGLHLPSIDADIYDQPEGTLQELARIGYTTLEVGLYYGGKVHGMSAEAFKALASKSGLKITSAHINHLHEAPPKGPEAERPEAEGTNAEGATEKVETPDPNLEWWSKALDTHRKLGCQYIVSSRLTDYPTDEDIATYADYFNNIGTWAREREMQFCYHPDAAAFRPRVNSEQPESVFEQLAERCDPEKVCFQIDTLEALEAGIDVVELLQRFGKRVVLLHLHDLGNTCESGRIDFDKIIKKGIETGVKDIFIEVRSFSLPPMNCIERSLYNVETLPSIRY